MQILRFLYFLSCVKLLRSWYSFFVSVSYIFLEDICNLFAFQLVPKAVICIEFWSHLGEVYQKTG